MGIITTTIELTWEEVAYNAVCDVAAGEKYVEASSGRFGDLEICQRGCEGNPECRSITFFKSGWCSHYSTPCTKTKWAGKATSRGAPRSCVEHGRGGSSRNSGEAAGLQGRNRVGFQRCPFWPTDTCGGLCCILAEVPPHGLPGSIVATAAGGLP